MQFYQILCYGYINFSKLFVDLEIQGYKGKKKSGVARKKFIFDFFPIEFFFSLIPKGPALFFMKIAKKTNSLESKLKILQMRVIETTLTVRPCS